jgi:hypothetical protein
MVNKLTLKKAKEIGGSVTKNNSKMPGTSYPLDAFACNVGSRLRDVEGSTCEKCYAIRLQKFRKNVDASYKRNSAIVDSWSSTKDRREWANTVAHQILHYGFDEHRWLDAGDIPSKEFLTAVCDVARLTPYVKHWIPTREISLLKEWLSEGHTVPSNLCIRVSAPMVDDAPLRGMLKLNVVTSTVHTKKGEYVGHECPASKQNNNCGDCRACWDNTISNVSYPLH